MCPWMDAHPFRFQRKNSALPMSNLIVLRMYRALMRQGKLLEGRELQRPLPADAQWGSHTFVRVEQEDPQAQLLLQLLPSLACTLGAASESDRPNDSVPAAAAWVPDPSSPSAPEPASTSASTSASATTSTPAGASARDGSIRKLVSAAFRAQQHAPPQQQQGLIDEAFKALRLALEQQYLSRCSSSRTTEGVRVEVTSRFDQMAVGFRDEKMHVFTYRVRISNHRQEPVKVLGRSWTIKNDAGQVRVHIPLDPNNAVVGQQPLLPPGHCFEYYSGTDLDTASGLQSGALAVDVYGHGRGRPATERITVEIAPFPLIHPNAFK